MEPVARVAKSAVAALALGEPMQAVNISVTDLTRSLVSLTWRTGFPLNLKRGFFNKVMDFYERVKQRVEETSVDNVERKRFVNLKVDLDAIVDGIVEHVRQSPDGLNVNYLEAQINGIPLEDACVNVGIQLKAYKKDIAHYRNVAQMVLGVPVMPTLAKSVVDVAGLVRPPSFQTMANFSTNLVQHPTQVMDLPGSAFNQLSHVSDTIQNLPIMPSRNTISQLTSPLSLFGMQFPQQPPTVIQQVPVVA